MITERELEISNESYINKSFADVYPELLELCQKITERWNPTNSNESDPGIVLMKLAAFVADKTNYNIDKNILEAFMPSATQESSMRKLCEMNGYEMKYYRSAITPISFMYNGDLTQEGGTPLSFSLKKYETVVKAEDDSLTYTLISDCPIAYSGVTSTATAIEGTIHLLTVGDETIIRYVNVDENNRVYLPERMIAENGIFIHDVTSGNIWNQVLNLNTQVLGRKVFKFGYDSDRGLPYVEFPSDIAALIGNGLYIYYTITSGVQGNTAANTITALSAPDSIAADQLDADANPIIISDLIENLNISNNAATTSGSNPESIDEAYTNFKRTVGTFDTLVTCRDYANFIYNIVDRSTLNYLVSNVQAADRRTDYNYSNRVATFTPDSGSYITSLTSNDVISPYDLCLYPLKPITASYTQAAYDASFKPLDLDRVAENEDLQGAKCLSHDYKDLAVDDVYCFKNKYTLDIQISTYEKLNSYQQSILLDNVKTALYKTFNARKVEYGEAISQEFLKSVVKNADRRISDVNFANFKVDTYFMNREGVDVGLMDQSSGSVLQGLVAKNVLAGRLSLFDYTESYDLEFGQAHVEYTPQYKVGDGDWSDYDYSGYAHINYADTEVRIPYADDDYSYGEGEKLSTGYALQTNETLQFIEPSLQSSVQYATYVNYRLENFTDTIPANTLHRLTGNELIRILYTDADTGLEKVIVYTASTITEDGTITENNTVNIFQANFELENADDSVSAAYVMRNGLKYLTLNSNQTIDKKVYVKTILNDAILRCYWILNNPENTLFVAGEPSPSYVLGDGEYFIYSNSSLTELTVLGSGTRLSLARAPISDWTISDEKLITIENISSQGLAAFSEVNWQNKYLTDNALTIEEMTITSFAEGDVVTLEDWNSTANYVGNDWVGLPMNSSVSVIKADGTVVTLPPLPASDLSTSRLVRSYLNLNCGPTKPQVLRWNHFVQLKYLPTSQLEDPIFYQLNDREIDWRDQDSYHVAYFKSDYLLQKLGGENVAVASAGNLLYSAELESGIHFILYKSEPVLLDGEGVERNSMGLLPLTLNKFNGEGLTLKLLPIEDEDQYILMYFDQFTEDISLSIEGGPDSAAHMSLFNHQDASSNEVTLSPGINILKLSSEDKVSELYISHTGELGDADSDTLYVGNIKLVSGYNSKISSLDMAGVLSKILSAATDSEGLDRFYYLYQPGSEEVLDAPNLLTPEALWDKNNVANAFTLAQIDFNASNISLTSASKL